MKPGTPKPVFKYQTGWEQEVPDELRALERWVLWRFDWDGKRWAKPLFQPRLEFSGPRLASSTDRATWGGFDRALHAFSESRKPLFRFSAFDGLGFVFDRGDGYVGVDLDACLRTDGSLEPWAREIYSGLEGSYCEVSPSGQGLKLFMRGRLPGNAGLRRNGLGPDATGALECYSSARYFTVTGARFADSPSECVDRGEAVIRLVARFRPAPAPSIDPTAADRTTGTTGSPDLSRTGYVATDSDDAILERARRASNGSSFRALFDFGQHHHASASEADFALCRKLAFWTGPDVVAIDRLFRRSRLYREKWDRRLGTSTYGKTTIANSLRGRRPSSAYSPPDPTTTPTMCSNQGVV